MNIRAIIYSVCIIIVIAATIVGIGMLGHLYLPYLALHHRFITWEIAAILMSLLINVGFFFESKTWQIAFYITEGEDRPFRFISIAWGASIAFLFFALLTIIGHYIPVWISPEHKEPIEQFVKSHENGLLLFRVLFILFASGLFWYIDHKVSKTTSEAKLTIEALIKKGKSTVDDGRLARKIRKWLKLEKDTVVTYELIDKLISMLSSSFGKSCNFNDRPVCFGFALLFLNGLLIEGGALERCRDGELSIWISGASAFQLMASGIVFAVITMEVVKRTQKLKDEGGSL